MIRRWRARRAHRRYIDGELALIRDRYLAGL